MIKYDFRKLHNIRPHHHKSQNLQRFL